MGAHVTQSTTLTRISTFPPEDVTMGSGSNAGNARVEVQYQFTFDDPDDGNLPISVSSRATTLHKYTDDTSNPPVTTSYSGEDALVRAICDEIWYGSYTGSLNPPPSP